jgi:hypothetical protein
VLNAMGAEGNLHLCSCVHDVAWCLESTPQQTPDAAQPPVASPNTKKEKKTKPADLEDWY